jgi:uncharacterized protein with ParB-like and HNH nuclease domain
VYLLGCEDRGRQTLEVFYSPVQYEVPLFQRLYVWSQETQWEPLWSDILRLIEVIEEHRPNATHFLGAIVVQRQSSGVGYLPELLLMGNNG